MRKPRSHFGNGTRFFKYDGLEHWQAAVNIVHFLKFDKNSLKRLKFAYKWLGQVIKYLEQRGDEG